MLAAEPTMPRVSAAPPPAVVPNNIKGIQPPPPPPLAISKPVSHVKANAPVWVQAPPDSVALAKFVVSSDLPLLPVAVKNDDGSECVVDHMNRVVQFTDAASRSYSFQYDDESEEVCAVSDDNGTWMRQRDMSGRLTKRWINPNNGAFWMGSVEVDLTSYRIEANDRKFQIRIDGTKYVEYFQDGNPLCSTKDDRFGNSACEDLVSRTIRYQFVDGRRALRFIDTGALLGYDPTGRLALLKDAQGRRLEFSDYDQRDRPCTVVNDLGKWRRLEEGVWRNDSSGRAWYGEILVDPDGCCVYVSNTGDVIEYTAGPAGPTLN